MQVDYLNTALSQAYDGDLSILEMQMYHKDWPVSFSMNVCLTLFEACVTSTITNVINGHVVTSGGCQMYLPMHPVMMPRLFTGWVLPN